MYIKECGYVDESVFESYEPSVDIDSGYIIEEKNAHVKYSIYSLLLSKSFEETPKFDNLLLESYPAFEKSMTIVKRYSSLYFGKMRQKLSEYIEGYAASQQQLEDLKTDKARLHQLANQVQANLEHYQQAMQSRRAEQALEIEKREGNFQHELHQSVIIQEFRNILMKMLRRSVL